MKIRLISLILMFSIILSSFPMLGTRVGAMDVMLMTEAEAWAAGVDVYMAWYNNLTTTTAIENYYNDSYFVQLYDDVFPTTDIRDQKLKDAFQMIEKHFNFVSDTDTLQYDIYMTLLYTCFYYFNNASSEDEIASMANYTAEQLDNINEILSKDLIQAVIDGYLENAWSSLGSNPIIENPPEILSTASTWFGSIELASDTLNKFLEAFNDGLDGVATGLQAYLSIKGAADEAAKFVNLDLLNDDFLSIILHLTNDGTDPILREAASTLYTMAIQNSNKFYKDALVSYTAGKGAYELSLGLGLEVCKNAFFTLASSSAASAGGAAASTVAGGIAAEFIGALALGLIIANLMETTIKGLDDLFTGGTRHSRADLNMYFLENIRSNLHIYYSKCLRDFKNLPNEYTARKLNAISKLMFNVLLCENDIAGESMRTYETAGLFNVGGESLKAYLQKISLRRDSLKTLRAGYTADALEAYSKFTESKVYPIQYNTTGGSFPKLNEMGFPSSDIKQYKIHSISQTIANTKPTREGYMFMGWTADPDSTKADPVYASGSLYTANEPLTLYAVWTKANCITFDAQNGSVSPSSKTFLTGESVVLPIPSRGDGYSFLGWSTDPNADTGEYTGSKSYTFSEGDITLYAIWQAKTFNIIFDANGGTFDDTGTITEVTKPKVYNADFVFDVDIPQRKGYTFMGWSLKNDNTVDWKYGEHTNDIGNATADDRRVYAIWADASATMVYDHGDWITDPDNPDKSIVEHADPIEVNVENGTTYALIEPVIKSYNGNSFKGWQYYNNGGSLLDANGYAYTLLGVGDFIELDPIIDKENYVLAKWQYYVHYNAGTEMVHEQGVDDYVIKAPVSSDSEQVFKHWKAVDENGNETCYKVGETIDLTSDLTLNAVWGTEDTVTPIITVLTNKTIYTPGDVVDIEIMVDNSGYFRVDASNSTGFKLKNAEGSKKSSAVFVENTSASNADDFKCYNNGDGYTVKLYIPANCSNGSYPIDITASNGIYDLASDSSVSGTETSTDTETLLINVNNGEEEKEYYTLSYHMNDGYGNLPEPVRFYDGEEVRLDRATGFERDGYEFIGWCENENGKGTKYKAGGYYSFDEDTLLYAVWEVDSDYEMPEELEMMIKLDRYSTKTDVSWYKPGATIGLRIDIDNSDHFFVDTRDCPNFTFSDANGNPTNAGTFYERTSPDYDGVQTTYTNGGVTYVSIKIPDNCRDGEYTIIVKGADSVIDQATGASNGNIITLGATVTVRKNELPDDIYLSKSEMILHKGNEKRLTAAMLPEYVLEGYHQSTGDLYVEWKTSNPKIASIDERGNRVDVIGESAGTAVITAYIDDISASCTITVVDCSYTVREIDEEYLASPATCSSPATYYFVCECGDVGKSTYKYGNVIPHDYSAWETVQQPTETTPGLEQRTCSECHITEESAIAALGKIKEEIALIGDINLDNAVDIRDAQLLFQYSMLPDLYPIDYSGNVDFNGDGMIDIRDAQRLFQYSMLPDLYPIS